MLASRMAWQQVQGNASNFCLLRHVTLPTRCPKDLKHLALRLHPASRERCGVTSISSSGNGARAKPGCPGPESHEVLALGGNKSVQTKLSEGECGRTFSTLIIISVATSV